MQCLFNLSIRYLYSILELYSDKMNDSEKPEDKLNEVEVTESQSNRSEITENIPIQLEASEDKSNETDKSKDESNEIHKLENEVNTEVGAETTVNSEKSSEPAINLENSSESAVNLEKVSEVSVKLEKSTEPAVKLEKLSEPVIKIQKALCADYRSASDSDSYDSEKDSSSSKSDTYETESDSDSDLSDTDEELSNADKNKKKQKKSRFPDELPTADLPPIEDLKISVPEDECQEIGVITSIVDNLVVVESYKGTAPLDIDSILFLDKGKRPLGKIFDVIGPVAEPVYTIRFTNLDQIKEKNIEKGMKVYCAPKTEHSSYVFLPDLLRMRGSDASWKDNMEPPPECQDFSDDEEEQKQRSVVKNVRNEYNRRRYPGSTTNEDPKKRTRFLNSRPPGQYVTPSRFKNPHFQRPVNKFTPSTSWSYQPRTSSSHQPQSSPAFTPFPGPNPFVTAVSSAYPNYPPPFGNFRFPNIPPFPPQNFPGSTTAPPPPPPPSTSSAQATHMSYPTRATGPPPYSSFMTPPPGNRPPVPPFPFSQRFDPPQRFYPQPIPFNVRPPPPPPPS